MKRNFLFVVAIVGAIILAWWAGYKLYDKDNNSPSAKAFLSRLKEEPHLRKLL